MMNLNQIKKKETLSSIAVMVLVIGFFLWYTGFFSPVTPHVFTIVSYNKTSIGRLVYMQEAFYTLFCGACDTFISEINVTYNGTVICENGRSVKNIGYAIIPISCVGLENYINQTVDIELHGFINGNEVGKDFKKDVIVSLGR